MSLPSKRPYKRRQTTLKTPISPVIVEKIYIKCPLCIMCDCCLQNPRIANQKEVEILHCKCNLTDKCIFLTQRSDTKADKTSSESSHALETAKIETLVADPPEAKLPASSESKSVPASAHIPVSSNSISNHPATSSSAVKQSTLPTTSVSALKQSKLVSADKFSKSSSSVPKIKKIVCISPPVSTTVVTAAKTTLSNSSSSYKNSKTIEVDVSVHKKKLNDADTPRITTDTTLTSSSGIVQIPKEGTSSHKSELPDAALPGVTKTATSTQNLSTLPLTHVIDENQNIFSTSSPNQDAKINQDFEQLVKDLDLSEVAFDDDDKLDNGLFNLIVLDNYSEVSDQKFKTVAASEKRIKEASPDKIATEKKRIEQQEAIKIKEIEDLKKKLQEEADKKKKRLEEKRKFDEAEKIKLEDKKKLDEAEKKRKLDVAAKKRKRKEEQEKKKIELKRKLEEELKKIDEFESEEEAEEETACNNSPVKKKNRQEAILIATQMKIPKKAFGPDNMDIYTKKTSGGVNEKKQKIQLTYDDDKENK